MSEIWMKWFLPLWWMMITIWCSWINRRNWSSTCHCISWTCSLIPSEFESKFGQKQVGSRRILIRLCKCIEYFFKQESDVLRATLATFLSLSLFHYMIWFHFFVKTPGDISFFCSCHLVVRHFSLSPIYIYIYLCYALVGRVIRGVWNV
jgi:hypothetical protein